MWPGVNGGTGQTGGRTVTQGKMAREVLGREPRLQFRLATVNQWYEMDAASDLWETLNILPFSEIVVQVHPDDVKKYGDAREAEGWK
jgi:hypothetical protein